MKLYQELARQTNRYHDVRVFNHPNCETIRNDAAKRIAALTDSLSIPGGDRLDEDSFATDGTTLAWTDSMYILDGMGGHYGHLSYNVTVTASLYFDFTTSITFDPYQERDINRFNDSIQSHSDYNPEDESAEIYLAGIHDYLTDTICDWLGSDVK